MSEVHGNPSAAIGRWRAIAVLTGFAALTLPLMPVQAFLARTSIAGARRLPHWYHRQVCRLLGIRLEIEGAVTTGKPVLLVANHSSWLDIPVLSAVAPLSFVAKKEVSGWPFVSSLARLQRTVFVDRTRRASVGATTGEMAARLAAGDTLALFAEGTSTDGNRVLPLRSSLFGAVIPGAASAQPVPSNAVVQSCAVVYSGLHGMPLSRAGRPFVGWYGDMEMGAHAWNLLKAGPLDVRIIIGSPVALDSFVDRKALATHTEVELRRNVVRLLRDREPGDDIVVTAAPAPARHSRLRPGRSAKWT